MYSIDPTVAGGEALRSQLIFFLAVFFICICISFFSFFQGMKNMKDAGQITSWLMSHLAFTSRPLTDDIYTYSMQKRKKIYNICK